MICSFCKLPQGLDEKLQPTATQGIEICPLCGSRKMIEPAPLPKQAESKPMTEALQTK